jgi:proteasome lid subunit RPN8/RPN11
MRDGRWRAWLTESARDVITAAAAAAHPNETGGVLLGVLTRSRPWIITAAEVPHAEATGTYYELQGGAAPVIVDAMTVLDPRLGYLGEWHSHPADVGPSPLDAQSMRGVAADPTAGCEHPVLIIARRRGSNYELDARQLQRRRLRVLHVIDAGPLPPHATKFEPFPQPPELRSEHRSPRSPARAERVSPEIPIST